MIPTFLALSDREKEMLDRYASFLSELADDFTSKVYEMMLNDAHLTPFIHDLTDERVRGCIKSHLKICSVEKEQGEYFKEAMNLCPISEMSIDEILKIYDAYYKHILDAVNSHDMTDVDRQILIFAVFKRINLLTFFYLNKSLKEQNSKLTEIETIHLALMRLVYLWNENEQMPLDELLKRTCEILVRASDLGLAWIGNVDFEDEWIKIKASAGDAIGYANNLHISIDEKNPYGKGPVGISLRSGKISILRDLSDPKFKAWRQMAKSYGLGENVSVPFEDLYGRKWVMAMYAKIDRQLPEYIENLLDDLSKSLKIFIDRKLSYLEIQRLKGYYRALSKIQNELIKIPAPEKSYKLVTETLIQYTEALTVRVSVPDPDSEWMKDVCASGKHAEIFLNQKIASKDPSNYPYGNTATGRAFRDKKPVIIENAREDPFFQQLWSIHPELKIGSVGSWPIFANKDDFPIAILTIHSLKPRYFDSEIIILIEQIVSSIETAIRQYDAKKQTEWAALHDTLTGLVNRNYFELSALDAMKRAKREKRHLAIGIADLDDFKLVNDTYGHLVGDELLKKIGNTFKSILRAGDVVSRLGGDEFLFHVMIDDIEDLEMNSKRLLNSLSNLEISGEKVTCSSSIGWAIYPDDEEDLGKLISFADRVAHDIKQKGGNAYGILNDKRTVKFQRADKVRTEFLEAIEKGDVQFFLQPKCDCLEGKIYGVEMLVRWKTENGWISPNEFINVVEEDHELIRALDCYTIEKASLLRDKLKNVGDFEISFNVGAKHFLDPYFLEDVTNRIKDGNGLKIEITESSALKNLGMTKFTIDALKKIGFKFSLDDFGTGYSSLIYASLPVDEIKLDNFLFNRSEQVLTLLR